MGFLGLPIPSIKVFGENSSNNVASDESPMDVAGTSGDSNSEVQNNLAGAQKSFESLHLHTSKLSGLSNNGSIQAPSSTDSREQLQQQHSHQSLPHEDIDTRINTDPISHMILKRAGTESQSSTPVQTTGPQLPSSPIMPTRSRDDFREESHLARSNSTNATKFLATYPNNPPSNENFKKSPSTNQGFFSKLLKSSGRPTSDDENDVTTLDKRDEGWNADVFGYVPNYPTPPKYIHVRAHRKQKRELNRVFLAQELNPHPDKAKRSHFHRNKSAGTSSSNGSFPSVASGNGDAEHGGSGETNDAIWCGQFSQDGKYFATAGEDRVIRVWQVLSSPKDRDEFEEELDEESDQDQDDRASFYSRRRANSSATKHDTRKRLYAPVFKSKPVREYYGHSSDVLDISWSKNNFLLSSSMDKTVRLWHVDRSECLCTFLHSDFVTSIRFHPTDDRFFLSGSLDCKLRLWSIPDKEVAYWKDVPDLITAVAFTPDGLTAIAGCFGGQCLFYETDGLNFQSQMHVRSSRGRNSKGSKITGIEAYLLPSNLRYQGSFDSEMKLLISTNDSRVRLYNFHDKSMEAKFKGHENEQSQINASFNDNGYYIISGSEDDRTYVWRAHPNSKDSHKKKDIQEYEYFHSNRSQVTVALFAPTAAKKVLSLSEDPVYDLCDPPPVRLMPKDDESFILEEPRQKNNSKRSNHPNGNIIITADREGFIKVFRQDCAYEARRMFAESSSLMKSKRLSTLSPTHSWRDSISIHRTRSTRGGGSSIRGISPSPVASNRAATTTHSNNGYSPLSERYNSSSAVATAPAKMASPTSSPSGSRRTSIGDGIAVKPTLSPTSSLPSVIAHEHHAKRVKSPLSIDNSSDNNSHFRNQSDDDELQCLNCHSTSFKAKRVDGRMTLACSNCNALAPSS